MLCSDAQLDDMDLGSLETSNLHEDCRWMRSALAEVLDEPWECNLIGIESPSATLLGIPHRQKAARIGGGCNTMRC